MADPLKEKAFAFALRIMKLAEYLQREHKEFTVSRKILDSGVSIGLYIEEARQGENRADFQQKYAIATKKPLRLTTSCVL